MSAGIYAARANQKTIILDKPEQRTLEKVKTIENYLGFPEGISGTQLLELARKQARRFGAEIIEEPALGIKPKNGRYVVETAEEEYETRGIIIATGIKHEKPDIKGLERLRGRGVSYCVVCDGFFFRGAKVGVIGSKDYAAREALELLNYTKDITIYTNGERADIRESLMEKLEENKIKIIEDGIEEVVGEEAVEGLRFKNGKTTEVKGIFVAVGTSGAVDFAKTLGMQIEGSTIRVNHDQSTGISRIYAAGDCTGRSRQVAVGVGDGAEAAIRLISELKGSKHIDYH